MLPLGRQNKKGKSSINHGNKSSLLPAISSVGNGGSPGLILPKLENKVCLVGASQEERQRRDKSRRRLDKRNTDGAYNNDQHEPRARQRQDDCSEHRARQQQDDCAGNQRINYHKLLPRRGPDGLNYDPHATLAAAADKLERTARNIGKKKTKKKKMVTTVASNTTITSSMISRAIRTRSESASPVREDLHLSLSSLNVLEKDSSTPVEKTRDELEMCPTHIEVCTVKPTIQASVNFEKGSTKAKTSSIDPKGNSSATSTKNASAKSDQRNGDKSNVNDRRSSTESDKHARKYDDITYNGSRNRSTESAVRGSKECVATATGSGVKGSSANSDSSIMNKTSGSVRQTTSKYVSSRATGPGKHAETKDVSDDCGIDIMNKTSNKHVITKHTNMTEDLAVKTASSKPDRNTAPKTMKHDKSMTKSNIKSDKSSVKTATVSTKPMPNKDIGVAEPGRKKATVKNTVGRSIVTTCEKILQIPTDHAGSSKVLVKPNASIKYNGPIAISKQAGNANGSPKGDCIPTVSVNGESVASRTSRPLTGQATTPPRSASTESIRTVLSASFSKSNESIITIISVPSSESSITKSPRQIRASVDSRDSTTSCSFRTTCLPRQRRMSVDSRDSTISCSSRTTSSTQSYIATPCNQWKVEDVSSTSSLTPRSDSEMSISPFIAVSQSQKRALVVSHSFADASPSRKRVPSVIHSSTGASLSQKRVTIVPLSSVVDASLSQKRVSSVSRVTVAASTSQKTVPFVSHSSIAASPNQKRVTVVSSSSAAATPNQKRVPIVSYSSVAASPTQKRVATVSHRSSYTSRSSRSASAMSGRRSGNQP